MPKKNEAQFISVVRGRKDGVLRQVTEIKSVTKDHILAEMRVGGVLVRQVVNRQRIEKVRADAKHDK